MKLRPEFETARAGLINRHPIPSLDTCLSELLREEQRLATQISLNQDSVSTELVNVAYAAQARGRPQSQTQCYRCREFGHIAKNCTKKFCNYCKKEGHIIKDCRIRPQNRQGQVFNPTIQSNLAAVSPTPPPYQPDTPSSTSTLTPEMVQQMIVSALSAFSIQGKNQTLTFPWLVDSAASNHMTGNSDVLHDVRKYTGNQLIQIANGSTLPITAVGSLGTSFNNVFVSPTLSSNLISVGQLVDNNYEIHFDRNGCCVQDQTSGRVIAKGPKVGRLFPLQFSIPRSSFNSVACSAVISDSDVWHKKLGHPNKVVLSHLVKNGYLGNKSLSSDISSDCSTCKLGKSKCLPFPSHGSRASMCFEIVHTDVWGVSPVLSHARYKYFVTFIDDYSRFTWIYFLRSKSEVFSKFQEFIAFVKTQFSADIKILRSDSGGEYMSSEFQSYLKSMGILSQRSCPYTPQQNGVAERKNRHLLDVVRTLLIESSVPPRFWVEALSTSVYLINRLPSQALQFDSPYSRLFGGVPEYDSLHIFGCVCFVHLPPTERTKLTAQAARCAFLGYSTAHKGYVCYDSDANKLRISRNVVFFENQYFFQSFVPPKYKPVSLPIFDHDAHTVESTGTRWKGIVYQRRPPQLSPPLPDPEPVSDPPLPGPRRTSRISRPPDRYGFSHTANQAIMDTTTVPKSYSQAATQACWQQAMEEELQALLDNHTWDIVPRPDGVKLIGCKWVYTVKLRPDGTIDRYKARLVALGNCQEYGLDYEETFAPVAKMTTVRTVMAIAASRGWSLHQMDVKNAFLHGDLKEEVYMTPPPGLFINQSTEVCRLKRSLYGLKQAPRAWFEKFRATLLDFRFTQSQYDSSLFLKKTATGLVILLVYVDDIVITGSDSQSIRELQQHLKSTFHMKDLGPLHYFLGLEVHSCSTGILLHQHKYTQELLTLAGLQSGNSVLTPIEVNLKLRQEDGELLPDPSLYRQLVGSLNYLTITRPDISFAVQQVSQFMQAPRHSHLAAVRRILRYLKGTSGRGLLFPKTNSLQLVGYSDADWAGCADTRRSVTGWCMFLGNALISWKSKKQDRVSKSSTESEYRAMSSACSEIVWLRGLLGELAIPQFPPTPLHADNTSAIQITANPVFHERTKHIEVDCHSIREAFDQRVITLPHIPTELQTADVFTKALSRQRHQFLVSKLMLSDSLASI